MTLTKNAEVAGKLHIRLELPDPLPLPDYGRYWAARRDFQSAHKQSDWEEAGGVVGERLAGALTILRQATIQRGGEEIVVVRGDDPKEMSLDIAFALGEMVQAWLTEQMQVPKEPSPTPSDLPSGEATPL